MVCEVWFPAPAFSRWMERPDPTIPYCQTFSRHRLRLVGRTDGNYPTFYSSPNDIVEHRLRDSGIVDIPPQPRKSSVRYQQPKTTRQTKTNSKTTDKMPTLRKIKRATSQHKNTNCSTFYFAQPIKPTHHPTELTNYNK